MGTAVVLTISDSRSAGQAEDLAGPAVVAALTAIGLTIEETCIIPDDPGIISSTAKHFVNRVSAIVTTGGTGIGPRDVTPEAIRPLFERELPGFGEIMRTGTFSKTPLSIIARSGAGVAGRTLVVMLPGSPKAVNECMSLITPAMKHILKILAAEPHDCQNESNR